MTVCIAAIGMFTQETLQQPVVILCSDRMITARRIREYELAEQTKSIWHRPDVALMMSGSVDSLLEAYHCTFKAVGRETTIAELAKGMADEMQKLRRREIERLYFEPYNLTIDDFIRRQKEWTPDFWERLNSYIGDDEADLGEVIIAGFDADGSAHLYTIQGAGWERSWNATGYCAIGIGAEHAEAEFAHALYSPKRPWVQAMRITFFAKKRAEEAPGVGPTTDLWHIMPGGAWYYQPQSQTVQSLSSLFRMTRDSEIGTIRTDADTLARVLAEEYGATPQTATEEKRREAEDEVIEAELAGPAPIDKADLRSGTQEGESEDEDNGEAAES